MTERARRIALASAIALALLAWTAWRIAIFLDAAQQPLPTYVVLADRIVRGEPAPAGDVSPTYLWLMVAMRASGLTPSAIASMQIAALTLAAVFCAIAAKRVGGWPAAIAAALLVLGNRAAFIVAAELDPKALIFLLTSGALALAASKRRWPVAIAAILLGINAVTHPYGFLILLVVAIAHRRAAMLLTLVPIVLVLALAPKTEKHSSSQFYEGNNPLATGAGGVAPYVVEALQARRGDLTTDPAYRSIGADWRAKAIANLREYPLAAAKRFAWKALLTVHTFDVYDAATANRLDARMPRFPAIPFGLAFTLAIVALVLHRNRRELAPFAGIAIVLIAALTIFVVSARQRNVLLVPLAILGGAGAAEIVALLRHRIERGLLVFGAVLIATAILGIEGRPMREHAYRWSGIAEPDGPERLFDRAVEYAQRGEWLRAEAILSMIPEYRPMRGNRVVSSVAYYRARAAIHLRMSSQRVQELLDAAQREAPGDPFVLALRAAHGDREASKRLDALHDPATRDLALRESGARFR
jgi:hypothetical protein